MILRYLLAVFLVALLSASSALAEKPSHAGKGKGRGQQHGPGREAAGPSITISFPSDARSAVRDYYAAPRHCPPGLAKKNNGCLPPGPAKKWTIGRPLPRDVIFHDLPRDLVVEIGLPPEGYRYVRAAADILLIAVGTGMVVDAIEDLGRL